MILKPDIISNEKPDIFLAGPIQGSIDWQWLACKLLEQELPNVVIANPRMDYGTQNLKSDIYNNQVDWETENLDYTVNTGITLFWLPKQSYEVSGREYGRTTRFELGYILGRLYRDWDQFKKLVIGIEDEFPGKRYFTKRLKDYLIHDNLEDTCKEAIINLKEMTWKQQRLLT